MHWISAVRRSVRFAAWGLVVATFLLSAISETKAKGKLHGVVVVVTEFGGDLNDPLQNGRPRVDLSGARAEIELALERYRIHADLDKGTIHYLASVGAGNRATPEFLEIEKSLRVFRGMLTEKVPVTAEDTFVFYFTGHGIKSDTDPDYPSLIVHQGGTEPSSENKDFHMPLRKVIDEMKRIKAGYKLVFVDACRNEKLTKDGKSFTSPPSPKNYHGENMAIFYASADSSRSYVHPIKNMGYFTFQLSRALSTADADGHDGKGERDNKVSIEDLSGYLKNYVKLATSQDPSIPNSQLQEPIAYYSQNDDDYELFKSVKADARAPFFFWHVMNPKMPRVPGSPILDKELQLSKSLRQGMETHLASKFTNFFQVRAYHQPIKAVGWPEGEIQKSEAEVEKIFNTGQNFGAWTKLPDYLTTMLDRFHEKAVATYGESYRDRAKIFAIFRPRKLAEDDWDMQVAFVRPIRSGKGPDHVGEGMEVFVDNLRYPNPRRLNGRSPNAQTWSRDLARQIVKKVVPELDVHKVLAACFQFQFLRQSDVENIEKNRSGSPEANLRYLAWQWLPKAVAEHMNTREFRALSHSVAPIEEDIVVDYCRNLIAEDASRHKELLVKGDPGFPADTVKVQEMNHVFKAFIRLSNIDEDLKKVSVVAEPARGSAYLDDLFEVKIDVMPKKNQSRVTGSVLSDEIAKAISEKLLTNWLYIARLRNGE